VARRVVIVDDDDISRRGMAGLLGDRPEIEIVAALNHAQALGWEIEWDGVDVLVIDAADDRCEADHFPGVAVVEAVRRRRRSEQTMVIVITGHFFNDAVRRRMREAQADFFYHRSELVDAERLYQAVLAPDRSGHGVPGPIDLDACFRLGLNKRTRVNQAVAYAADEGLIEILAERTGLRRRIWQHRRRAFNAQARLNPVNADGRPPERDQADPSLPQIERFLRWATKTKE
jgi:CheY-like chemotaxis protein